MCFDRETSLWYALYMHKVIPKRKRSKSFRTTMFLYPEDALTIAQMITRLGPYGVENTSQAIRTALRFWKTQHPDLTVPD